MHLMTIGLSNQGIAAQLSLSVKSVEATSRSAFLRLGLVEENTHENRRVLAIRRYQTLVTQGDQPPIYLDEAGLFHSALLDSIPDDYYEFVALLEAAADSSEQPWAMWALASWSAVIADDLVTAARFAGHSVARAQRSGTYPEIVACALKHMVDVAAAESRIDHTLLGTMALLIDPATPTVGGAIVDTMDPLLEFAHWMVYCDRPLDARRFIARARRPVGDALDETRTFTAAAAEAELCIRNGQWTAVYELVAPVISASERGAAYYRSLAARAAIIAGDWVRADEEIRIGGAAAITRNDRSSLQRIRAADGALALRSGQPERAAVLLRQLHQSGGRGRTLLPSMNPWHADLVEALVAIGELSDARLITAELGALATATGSTWSAALYDRALGLTVDSSDGAIEAFERSAQQFAAVGGAYEQSLSLSLAAEAHRRRGDSAFALRIQGQVDDLQARFGLR
jgi:hypothetical protein